MTRALCSLLAMISGVALLALSLPAQSQPAASFQLITDGVSLLPGTFVAGQQPDGNSVLIEGEGGWILFDAGRHRAHSDALAHRIERGKPAQLAFINSHWHLDHSGGFTRLRPLHPDAPLYASAAIGHARSGFLQRYRAQLQGFAAAPVPGGPSPAVIASETELIDHSASMEPSVVVERTGEIELQGRKLTLGMGRGVSDGDVWVLDQASGSLLSGDLVTQPVPLFDTACAKRWKADLQVLSQQRFERLVPGHGAVMSRADFDAWRGDFERLLECAAGPGDAAVCRNQWLAGQAETLSEADRALAKGLLDYYLSGPLSAAGQAERCAEPLG